MLELRHITKSYSGNEILKNLNIHINKGEIVALVGKSGSGKSTAMQIAGLLEKPTAGDVIINEQNYSSSSCSTRTKARRLYIGFIYQFHHLINDLSVSENIALPLMIQNLGKKVANYKAEELLEKFNLRDKIKTPVSKLSGGEKQRIAIARALIHDPLLILADEPTGNLDSETAENVIHELKSHSKSRNASVLFVTHSKEISLFADRIVVLSDIHNLGSDTV